MSRVFQSAVLVFFLVVFTLVFTHFASQAMGATKVDSFLGTYKCTSLMRTAPKLNHVYHVPVTVSKAGAKRVRLSWTEANYGKGGYTTGELSTAMTGQGDLEYRSQSPVVSVTLQNAPAGKYLSFSINEPKNGVVASTCMKQK